MTPSFSSFLVNEPFGDPGLYLEVKWSRRSFLFDLGENESLGPTRLLRATDVFISHTHMDHFIGFDRILRIALGRGKTLRLYGPPGLIANVGGKLRGYTWNLTDGYPLTIQAQEFDEQTIKTVVFRADEGFRMPAVRYEPSFANDPLGIFPVLHEPMFTVSAAALNHRIPSFAYAIHERFHININKERLHEAGLPVGSWLRDVKQHIWNGQPDDLEFTALLYFEHRKETRLFRLGDVKRQFVTITRGQKIVYVVDVRYDDENETKIVELAKNADMMYCEAPYLHRDADKARDRYHLTAHQAVLMAAKAAVRNLVVFHFSPRYTGQGEAIAREAQETFERTR